MGTILYLTKLTRPDLSNISRELSKVMKKSTLGDYKALKRVLKYVLDTSDLGLVLMENGKKINHLIAKNGRKNERSIVEEICEKSGDIVEAYVYSDWDTDEEDLKSFLGWIIFVNGSALMWGSRGKRSVTLSSTTAEYVALTEVCKEILYVNMVASVLRFNFILPIRIYCDNMGALFLAKNYEGKRTKYLDIRYHFVREYVRDGIFSILFVPTLENRADPFTKNVSNSIFAKNRDYLE